MTKDHSKFLDYATPPKRDPAWFRFLVIGACCVGAITIIAVLAACLDYVRNA